MTLNEFFRDFKNGVHRDAGMEGGEAMLGDAFTRKFQESLAEAGEIADAEVSFYGKQGTRLDGYVADENEDTLDLFVSLHLDGDEPERVEKSKVATAFRHLASFYQKAATGSLAQMEETEPAFLPAQLILGQSANGDGFSRVRLFLLTDGLVNVDRLPNPPDLGAADVSLHVWDIARLFRWYTSGKEREQISIDVEQHGRGSVRCLEFDDPAADYVTYLAIFPADVLVSIYAKYGPRLLERNVRSFLQVRGEINKGIRTTILEEPARFLAYNNGLTATASKVVIRDEEGGAKRLIHLSDLQIVNGGQTTASLFRAVRKDKADVSDVSVPVKITRVRDPLALDEMVARISKFANSQNKVSVSDLSANDPFHRKLEDLSRTIWAPATSGSNRETKWFYERARAQYIDELGRATKPAQKSRFEREYPRSQLFGKTELAKYELAWDQRPNVVSRGAQKCFVTYHEAISRRGNSYLPDDAFFKSLVAKKILFDGVDRLVRLREYGGYKAQIVAYTVAMVSHLTGRRFDFEEIWRIQEVPEYLHAFLHRVADGVQAVIADPPRGKDVTEWYKSEACWKRCLELDIPLPARLKKAIAKIEAHPATGIGAPTVEELGEIEWAKSIAAEIWFGISKWAKETGSLLPWQRALAFSLGRKIGQGGQPTPKQAIQGRKLYEEAVRLGFFREQI